ncbi:MAG: hypothetical protein ACD_58C00324G0004 [uncultured bacterium]|nr:MAG: hypothetical protein ACD_58C00324G0004 [uncultured bacterium]
MTKTLFKGISKTKDKIIKYLNRDRIVAISLLTKIISLVLVTSFMPITNSYADNEVANNAVNEFYLKLDTNNQTPVVLSSAKAPVITPGESNYNKRIREDKEKKMAQKRANASRTVVSREYRDYDVPLEQKRNLAKRAAAQYGIDWKILEAVWQVESGKEWITSVKSYAGAQGPMQFMRGTWNRYVVDGNGDGIADINDAQDAVYAGANLLAQAGAATGNVDKALFSYNHAQWYVNKVKAVANSINE